MNTFIGTKPTGKVGKRNGNYARIAAQVAKLTIGGKPVLVTPTVNNRVYCFLAANKLGFQIKTRRKEKSFSVERIALKS